MTTSEKRYIVVVGVDYSTIGDLALDRALRLCGNEALSTLHVVNVAHVVVGGDVDNPQKFDANAYVARVEARLLEYVEKKTSALRAEGKKLPQRVLCHVRWDAPGEEIAQLAADVEADLVVVGTHGLRGLRRLLTGSVAEAVVRLAPCPVFVERPKGVPNVPTIEPPCPECLKVRAASSGATYWCAQHSERHGQRHAYFGGGGLGGHSLPSVGW